MVDDDSSNWEEADDPVKNGGDGEEERHTKGRQSFFLRKQNDHRRMKRKGH